MRMDREYVYLIKSEFDLLSGALQSELLEFSDDDEMEKGNEFKVSPFLLSLNCGPDDIVLMEEFFWSMDEEELSAFKQWPSGQTMYCRDEFECTVGDSGKVKFKMFVQRKSSDSKYVGFGFKIIESSFPSISGRFSVEIKEVEWYRNECPFYNLKKGGYKGTFAFDDERVDTVNSMTIRFNVHFYE